MKDGTLRKTIPIVALTAYNDERESCINAGMKRFCNIIFNS
jgi:CheY-like chemotaxis protein